MTVAKWSFDLRIRTCIEIYAPAGLSEGELLPVDKVYGGRRNASTRVPDLCQSRWMTADFGRDQRSPICVVARTHAVRLLPGKSISAHVMGVISVRFPVEPACVSPTGRALFF